MAEETLLIKIGGPAEEQRDGWKVPFYCESKGIRDYPNYMIKVPGYFLDDYPVGQQAFVKIEKLVNAKTNEPYRSTWVFKSEAELTQEEQEELETPSPAPSPIPQPRNAYEMGMAKGNAINAISNTITAHIKHHGTLPTRDVVEEAAYLINIGADAILNGREAEEHEEVEEEDDTSTTPSS
jgi:hypothetical protein